MPVRQQLDASNRRAVCRTVAGRLAEGTGAEDSDRRRYDLRFPQDRRGLTRLVCSKIGIHSKPNSRGFPANGVSGLTRVEWPRYRDLPEEI
jgi:hypothetical protein